MESVGCGTVDSALCAGMKDPRERAALFRLEQCYQEFCNSGSYWMEVGGAYNNCVVMGPASGDMEYSQQQMTIQQQQQAVSGHQTSFHRLLVHRLADRFAIRRESRSPNTIRLYKVPETRIPTVLLVDLDPAIYYPSTNNGVMLGCNHNGSNPNLNNLSNSGTASPLESVKDGTTPGTAEKQQKKKIIMKKRSPGQKNLVLQKKSSQQSLSSDASALDAKSRPTDCIVARSPSSDHLEAKERAYAEARARIFNDEDESNSNPDEQQQTATDPSTHDEQESATASASASAEKLLIQPEASDSNDCGNLTINSATEISPPEDRKAVYRNRAEEAADPDFRRGKIRAPVIMGPVPTVGYGAGYYPSAVSPVISYHSTASIQQTPLTASAPVFVPGGGVSYQLASGGKSMHPWGSQQHPKSKTPHGTRYDHQQPRVWWPQQQQQQTMIAMPIHTSSQMLRKQQYYQRRPGSFSSPTSKDPKFRPTPNGVVVVSGATAATTTPIRPVSAPPSATAASQTASAPTTLGVQQA